MRIVRFACWLALPVGLIVGSINGAIAQSQDAVQACTPDAMRLCSEFIPDREKVRTCMLHKRGQLSAECRTAMHVGGPAHGHYRGHRHYRHRS
jgi:hypothetical protein